MGKKRKRKPGRGSHESLVDIVEERLRENPRYSQILKHELYETGEMDVLALGPGIRHYYEIKSNDGKSTYAKALDQARRFYTRFGTKRGTEFIYVAWNKGRIRTERIRPYEVGK